MLKFVSLTLLLAVATPAVAQTSAPLAPQPTQAKPKTDPLDKVICRSEEVIGSRLNTQRVCMTAREWKDQADASRDATERLQLGQGTMPSK